MGKKLNDWLDEFVVNGANPNEVPEWPDNVSGSGIELVNTLPTTGNVNKLYKLPNGDIYSWFHEETSNQVPVYKEIEVNDIVSVKQEDIPTESYQGTYNADFDFTLDNFVDTVPVLRTFRKRYSDEDGSMEITFDFDDPLAELNYNPCAVHWYNDDIAYDTLKFGGTWDDDPIPNPLQFRITQQFVDSLSSNGLSLEDISIFLIGEIDHYEIVTTINEGWKKVNGEMSFDELILYTDAVPEDHEYKYVNITINGEAVGLKPKGPFAYLLDIAPQDIMDSEEGYWDEFKTRINDLVYGYSVGYTIEGLHSGDILHFEGEMNDSPSGLVPYIEVNGEYIENIASHNFSFDITITKNTYISFGSQR